MSKVVIEHMNGIHYPLPDDNFNPDKCYPEYPFGSKEISTKPNNAYELVRNCLADMGLDEEHRGTEHWNPLGAYIKPGDFVVIKPNLVMHVNENKHASENAFECLITNPACIRAICDYCIIALNGSGRLMIGDAPMQGCDFDALLKKSSLPKVIDFYKGRGITVELKDFRQYQSKFNANKVIVDKKYNDTQGIVVHMGAKSQHMGSNSNGIYQVSDYDKADTAAFHHDAVHDYEINRDILQADVVINLCKPKTHRLAGITAAMKNMVGITYNKACLPHRSAGSVEERGDAYQHKSFLKRVADDALTRKIRAENAGNFGYATLLRYVYGISLVLARKFGKDTYYIGGWYGNDTIWRTICDLNYIIRHADKSGVLHDEPQRQMLNFGDMIIAGEKNGPVSPSTKMLGVVIASEDPAAFDVTLCKLMGFPFEKIPLARNLITGKTIIPYTTPEVIINGTNSVSLDNIKFPEEWKFEPHDAWK